MGGLGGEDHEVAGKPPSAAGRASPGPHSITTRGGLTKRIGKFEVQNVLGSGGMGTVYKARDPILDRLVALKTVSAQLLANEDARVRFQREARAAARLQHPNIVTVFELGEADGTVFIAMELLPGIDLVEAMVPPERLPLPEKLRVIVQVCRGLDFAHKKGVIHRDVKPANIRLLPDGVVKLAMLRAANSARASPLAPSPSQFVSTGLLSLPVFLRFSRVARTASATAVLEASAVGQFMTRTASDSGSSRTASRAP